LQRAIASWCIAALSRHVRATVLESLSNTLTGIDCERLCQHSYTAWTRSPQSRRPDKRTICSLAGRIPPTTMRCAVTALRYRAPVAYSSAP